jgi:uncharacterized protein (TIGR00299 family) protein
MKILYYDCFSGISGDMNLGALIDIGVDKDYLLKELLKLNIGGYKIEVRKDNRKGIYGTKVNVILTENYGEEHMHNDNHSHEEHKHSGHSHENEHNYVQHEDHEHVHEHEHRNLKDIQSIINSSDLKEQVKKIALEIFKKVAEAEAKIHNKHIEEVHFHEVGAVDSIVDIVGAAICLDYLKVDKIKSSTVEVGSGFVKCAHGMLPVPAPATAEILNNIPVKSKISFEATTPTGAAILANCAAEFTDEKNFKITKTGYGIGHRDIGDIPNVLRVFIGEESETAQQNDYIEDEAYVMECNIDDMNPELYEYVIELIFKAGALDVYMTPIIMKKQRPAIKLNVLCKMEQEGTIKDIILTHTTTLGFRKYKVKRNMLKREFVKVTTKYGDITVKNAYYKGKKIKSKPEYEECKKIALKGNVSISEVYKEIFSKI